MTSSYLWHDYETFGANPRRDYPVQFAALRTDPALQPIDDPVVLYCQPPRDRLPSPQACLITGITPQQAQIDGSSEVDFATAVRQLMLQPGTCTVGYNNLRFDDEVSRNLFYRNFYDAYEREYQNGNSRWDLIDLVRACYALRPDGIEWPLHGDSSPSFRLQDLSAANDIDHEGAHDALSDVHATLALARLVKAAQPRLFDYGLTLRQQKVAAKLIDPLAATPFVHTSSRIKANRGCTSVFLALARHPQRPKSVIAVDLNSNIDALFDVDGEDLADYIFTPSNALPDGVERLAVKTIASNRVPFVAPLGVLNAADPERIDLDIARCRANAARLKGQAHIADKLAGIYAEQRFPEVTDPDLMLYSGGFFSNDDRKLVAQIHQLAPEELAGDRFPFQDARLPKMLFRFRARNYPHSLTAAESDRWQTYRMAALTNGGTDGESLNIAEYLEQLHALRKDRDLSAKHWKILDQLTQWPAELGIRAEPPAGTGRQP